MAHNQEDDWADGLGWSSFEQDAFERIGNANGDVFHDQMLQTAFDVGYFNQDVDDSYREAAREFVVEWLHIEYDVDFDAEFDWASWRENYEGTD
jgi:hypothetical protein